MTDDGGKKTRIVFVLPYLEMGGTEKHVRDLAARIDRRRFEPMVVALAGGGVLEREFDGMGVPVRVLGYKGLTPRPGKGWTTLLDTAACIIRLALLLHRERVRIVHAFLPAANLVAAAAGTIAGVPARVVSKRALSRPRAQYPFASGIESLANLFAHTVVVNSEAVEQDVRGNERFWAGKIRLIYNGIDMMLPDPEPIGRLCPDLFAPEGAPVIVSVANLFPYKGHVDLVRAARDVVDAIPTAHFLLVGKDAGAGDAVRGEIDALGLGGRVALTGFRPDAVAILAASTLVVHPSHEEGFSNTILEAMAAGKAVVATRVGGIPEAVEDGQTGLLVPPGNPRSLGQAILSLLRDPERARAMGEAGKKRVREAFSLETMVRKAEQLYESLCPGIAAG